MKIQNLDLNYYVDLIKNEPEQRGDLSEALLEDLEHAYTLTRRNQHDRRSWIRTCWALMEGIAYAYSVTCLTIHRTLHGRPSDALQSRTDAALELLIVDNLRASIESKIHTKHDDTSLEQRLKFIIHTVNTFNDTQCDGAEKITLHQKFSQAKLVRNRITHPKKTTDLEVSPDDIKITEEVFEQIGLALSAVLKIFSALSDAAIESIPAQSNQ